MCVSWADSLERFNWRELESLYRAVIDRSGNSAFAGSRLVSTLRSILASGRESNHMLHGAMNPRLSSLPSHDHSTHGTPSLVPFRYSSAKLQTWSTPGSISNRNEPKSQKRRPKNRAQALNQAPDDDEKSPVHANRIDLRVRSSFLRFQASRTGNKMSYSMQTQTQAFPKWLCKRNTGTQTVFWCGMEGFVPLGVADTGNRRSNNRIHSQAFVVVIEARLRRESSLERVVSRRIAWEKGLV